MVVILSLYALTYFSGDLNKNGLKDGDTSCVPENSFIKIGRIVKRTPCSCPDRGTEESPVCGEGQATARQVCLNSLLIMKEFHKGY